MVSGFAGGYPNRLLIVAMALEMLLSVHQYQHIKLVSSTNDKGYDTFADWTKPVWYTRSRWTCYHNFSQLLLHSAIWLPDSSHSWSDYSYNASASISVFRCLVSLIDSGSLPHDDTIIIGELAQQVLWVLWKDPVSKIRYRSEILNDRDTEVICSKTIRMIVSEMWVAYFSF